MQCLFPPRVPGVDWMLSWRGRHGGRVEEGERHSWRGAAGTGAWGNSSETPPPLQKKNTAPLPSATQCGCLLCIGVLKCIPINISFFYFTLLWVWRRDSYCRCKTANKSNAFGSAKTGGILIALYLFHYTQEICLCVDRNQTMWRKLCHEWWRKSSDHMWGNFNWLYVWIWPWWPT